LDLILKTQSSKPTDHSAKFRADRPTISEIPWRNKKKHLQ